MIYSFNKPTIILTLLINCIIATTGIANVNTPSDCKDTIIQAESFVDLYFQSENDAYDIHIAAASTGNCKGLNEAHTLYYEMWEDFSEFDKLNSSFYSFSCSPEQRKKFRDYLNQVLDLQFSAEISIHLIVDQKNKFSCQYFSGLGRP